MVLSFGRFYYDVQPDALFQLIRSLEKAEKGISSLYIKREVPPRKTFDSAVFDALDKCPTTMRKYLLKNSHQSPNHSSPI